MMEMMQQRRAERAAEALRLAEARHRRLQASADTAERLYASMASRPPEYLPSVVAAHREAYLASLAAHLAALRQLADAAEMGVLWWEMYRDWGPARGDGTPASGGHAPRCRPTSRPSHFAQRLLRPEPQPSRVQPHPLPFQRQQPRCRAVGRGLVIAVQQRVQFRPHRRHRLPEAVQFGVDGDEVGVGRRVVWRYGTVVVRRHRARLP